MIADGRGTYAEIQREEAARNGIHTTIAPSGKLFDHPKPDTSTLSGLFEAAYMFASKRREVRRRNGRPESLV